MTKYQFRGVNLNDKKSHHLVAGRMLGECCLRWQTMTWIIITTLLGGWPKKGNGKEKILKLVEYCTLVGVATIIVSSVVSHWIANEKQWWLVKWRNSGINCEAYNTFYHIGSDHRPMSATLQLSLRANKCTTVKKK